MLRKTVILFAFTLSAPVFADEKNPQPYIDYLKKEIEPEHEGNSTFLEMQKRRIEEESPTDKTPGSFTEKLRASDPLRENNSEAYTEKEKLKLEPKEEKSAIEAVMEGHSELNAKKTGNIHHAFGLRYGLGLSRDVSASGGGPFKDIYGNTYAPDLSLFYEFQPFHSEWFGNIGFMGMGGVGYYHGLGQFASTIRSPSGGTFPSTSNVKFQFFTLPVTVAVNYRFNLFRVLRPFIYVGPTVIGYVEKRNDGGETRRGYSKGLLVSTGVSVLLDWMSPGDAWDLYASHGVHHYYFTLEYSRLSTLAGDVNVAINGIVAGIAFEY